MAKDEPKWWTAYWLTIVAIIITISVTLLIAGQVSVDRTAIFVVFALAFLGIAYYGRLKPSKKLNRIMYMLIGVPIAFVLWYIFWFLAIRAFPYARENVVLVIVSYLICLGIGTLIGDSIGRLRHYKGPEQYQP